MPESSLRFIKRISKGFISKNDIASIPDGLRGIYVLYKLEKVKRPSKAAHNVVYIGLATNGFKGRLRSHRDSEKKKDQWDACALYEVWDNVRDEEIEELEGLFRHVFRKDSLSNTLAVQRNYKHLEHLDKIEKKVPKRRRRGIS
jgi:hypothetical protein